MSISIKLSSSIIICFKYDLPIPNLPSLQLIGLARRTNSPPGSAISIRLSSSDMYPPSKQSGLWNMFPSNGQYSTSDSSLVVHDNLRSHSPSVTSLFNCGLVCNSAFS
ncbi:hypothetical protein LINPERHAP1_LOCUS42757 [Linum perenne]